MPIADQGAVLIVIANGDGSLASQQFHPLIIAVGGIATIADCTDYTIGKAQGDDRRIHIANLSDSGIAQYAGLDEDLLHLAANQETSHIKIVDAHIQEEAAGGAQIDQVGRRGIVADDVEEMWLADLALLHRLAHASIIGIEASIEANLKLDPCAFYCGPGPINGWQV